MKFHFEYLGPIKNADIELGDLTFILGYPSTGKSYILKAIYHSLLLLDNKFQEIVKEKITSSLQTDIDNLIIAIKTMEILAPNVLYLPET
ncbi:hypothetical protein SJAV_09350 [Sulfurisphaera javensis]|uniref:AAA domain-containing protein n=1 Tax=Sulfurisphaera javensis TaxID=2049879 RepID=A0AAT9GPZ9_9CREN